MTQAEARFSLGISVISTSHFQLNKYTKKIGWYSNSLLPKADFNRQASVWQQPADSLFLNAGASVISSLA
ncbi:MAG: hypothetical protein ACI91G_000590 [Gammaproteobacteria bacterium]